MGFYKSLFFCLIIVLFSTCGENVDKNSFDYKDFTELEILYSNYLQIQKYDSVYKVNISNPWQGASNVIVSYFFSNKINSDNIIPIPVKKIVCFSSSHVAFLSDLGVSDKIVGISGVNYINDTLIQSRYLNGYIYETGYEDNLNYEEFVKNKPDIALIYGIASEHASFSTKLKELGIPTIYIAEYLENNPLGRLEWIKFFGLLTGKFDEANALFYQRSLDYKNIKEQVLGIENKPTVFVGSPIGDAWFVPGGQSYMANLINDAGANYLFSNINSSESKPLSFENIYINALESDFWLHCELASTIEGIIEYDKRLRKFKSIVNRKVFNNNKRLNQNNGNDFWEKGVVNPQLLLKDLIKVFHPNVNNQHELVFYNKID